MEPGVLDEIVCFPFIVLELTAESGGTLGVRVYDQQLMQVKPEWHQALGSQATPYAATLAQCIRKVSSVSMAAVHAFLTGGADRQLHCNTVHAEEQVILLRDRRP